MSTLPKDFEYQGIYCYHQEQDPTHFYYIPGVPSPQRTSQGTPAISLFVLDDMAMLQVSSHWEVTEDQLDVLKLQIIKQFPALKLVTIQLVLAPLEISQVLLTLRNNVDSPEVLGTSKSSGSPPFSAVFSVTLTNEQKAQAVSVFNGRKELLTVTYQATLSITNVSVEITVLGDISQTLKQLKSNPDLGDCLKQIETAIAQKQLTLESSIASEATLDLQQKTEKLAKDRAADLLLQLSKSPTRFDHSKFRATAKLTESIPIAFERSSDISSWFNGNGLDYMQLIGSDS